MTAIRPLRASDVQAVIEIARRFHAESPTYSSLPFSAGKVREHISWPFSHPHARAWFVAERDGEIVGAMGARVVGANCSDALISMDDGWYVEPSARGMMIGKRLADRCEAWARTAGAKLWLCAISAGLDPAGKTARMFDLLGYERGGTVHYKRLE